MTATQAPTPDTTTPTHTHPHPTYPPTCKHPHPSAHTCLVKIPSTVVLRPTGLTVWELDLVATLGDGPVDEWEMVDRRRTAHGTTNPYGRLHGHRDGLRRNDLTALWSAFVITANRAL